ncbi:MAG: excinuclease ABC subunit UvrA, partial [Kiritimatiellaeota bacterium]|nr:excinuclease ABC subunit UvrA [Kiritimatiellota bacterium]
MPDDIRIIGAREHNLKNIDVRIPRNQLTVITGLSGSGKSSLAFDTLYAEGQRRYVESLSAYARQFLDQMQKPDVEHIDGLSPAIAIEQRNAGSNPRSIVATTTEIHDYLRLLFANIGKPHCPQCGRPVERQSAEQITESLMRLDAGTKIILLAPVVAGLKGRHEETFQMLQKQGFVRARVDGEMVEVEAPPKLDKNKRHTIEAVVDRLVAGPTIRQRLTDSVEQTLKAGNAVMRVLDIAKDGAESETLFSEKNACVHCNISFEELKPRNFSFNAPYGACPDCAGLGSRFVFDEDLVVPDKTAPLETAIVAWRRGGHRMILYYRYLLRAIAKHFGVDLKTPYEKLPADFRRLLMHGTGDENVKLAWRKFDKPFEGVLANLTRLVRETESEDMRERLQKYQSKQRCSTCNGARLKPEVRACLVSEKSIVDACAMNVRGALEFFNALTLTPQEEKIASEVLKEIRRRLGFLADVGLDYL